MHLEVLVEELSAEAALSNILPALLGQKHSFRIHPFRGKQDLLTNLPLRLSGYRSWIPEDWRIVVLVDRNGDDCRQLKNNLEAVAHGRHFHTGAGGMPFGLLNRIAVEELEAWFFGDVEALREAYPRIPQTLEHRKGFRLPDRIQGGTWEQLERILKAAGYYPTGMPKIQVARDVSRHMRIDRNRSPSFQVFCAGVRGILT